MPSEIDELNRELSNGPTSSPPNRRRNSPDLSPLDYSSKKLYSSRNPIRNLEQEPDLLDSPDKTAPPEIQRFPEVIQWIIYLSKLFLNIPPKNKALFYVALAVICYVLSEVFEPFRGFYFFRKESFLNQWFVKLSWGWTFWLLAVFFGLCGYVESDGTVKTVARNVTRLLVGTAVWFGVTSTFMGIERKTGSCSNTDLASRRACVDAGENWSQFDISGHAFLLIYCGLLILEEARGFFKWEKEDIQSSDDATNEEEIQFDEVVKPKLILAIRIIAVALAMLAMLWDFMLIITLIYYHDFVQRLLGVFMGIAAWFLTYQVWYPNYYPGRPGDVITREYQF